MLPLTLPPMPPLMLMLPLMPLRMPARLLTPLPMPLLKATFLQHHCRIPFGVSMVTVFWEVSGMFELWWNNNLYDAGFLNVDCY